MPIRVCGWACCAMLQPRLQHPMARTPLQAPPPPCCAQAAAGDKVIAVASSAECATCRDRHLPLHEQLRVRRPCDGTARAARRTKLQSHTTSPKACRFWKKIALLPEGCSRVRRCEFLMRTGAPSFCIPRRSMGTTWQATSVRIAFHCHPLIALPSLCCGASDRGALCRSCPASCKRRDPSVACCRSWESSMQSQPSDWPSNIRVLHELQHRSLQAEAEYIRGGHAFCKLNFLG